MSEAPRVLVTGASGFVGVQVVSQLRRRGTQVVAVDHRWVTAAELEAQAGADPVDAAIHLGWYAGPRDYLTNAAQNLASLRSSLLLVDHLRGIGCGHLVVAGSCAEYGESDQPRDESDPVDPWSVYGATKAALHLVLDHAASDQLSVTWARLFNLTGPGEHPDRLFPAVVRSLRAGQAMALSPGEQVRDYLDVADVAAALVHLADGRVAGAVNVCSGRGVALRVLLDGLGERLGRPELLGYGQRPYGAHDSMLVVGRNQRLEGSGWTPTFSLDQVLDRVVQAHPGASA